jgi:acetyl esterase/lipase
MTRGQESLAIELEAAPAAAVAARAAGGERPRLIVVCASDDELAEHARVLASIAKEARAGVVWREADAAAA